MKLAVTINEEQIAEIGDLADNYTKQEDGSYLLTVEGMTHEDVGGLKSALQKERDNRKALEKQLAENGEASHAAERYQKRFYAAKRDAAISDALAMEGGNPELLAPMLREKVRVKENGDAVEFQVMNGDAVLLDDEGKKMTLQSYVKSLKSHDSYKGSFRGLNQNGGNSFQGEGDAMPRQFAPMKKRSLMTTTEKVDYINEHGQAAFDRLPM